MTSSENDNPLNSRTSTIPFDRITTSHIQPAVDELLKVAGGELAALEKPLAAPTWETLMQPLDELGTSLDFAVGLTSHLESVETTPELRKAYEAILPAVSAFRSRVILSAPLWENLKRYAETPQAKSLSGHRKRFLRKTIDSFRRNGADLGTDEKIRLTAIDSELATLAHTFSKNTLDATNDFEFLVTDPEKLRGLPESALAQAQHSARSKGKEGYRFTLHQPSYVAIMTYLEDSAIRELFFRAYNVRGTRPPYDNVETIHRILALRKEKARLLGYADFSDLILADRMAGSGSRAGEFVDDLRSRVEPAFGRETKALEAFVAERGVSNLNAWDVTFWSEKMQRAVHDFDEESLRPYFALPAVLDGLFWLCEKLFQITVIRKDGLPVWHSSVQTFEIRDENGELLGRVYADLFPRESKRGGAWMNDLFTRVERDAPESHAGLIAANFTPPTSDTPALLTHDEVTTLFHEFGHLLHQILCKVELRSQTMGGVPWDFIELPSQILENWCWEKVVVDRIGRHYQTGELIPGDLFARMKAARNFRMASFLMRQVGLSTIDLALHRSYDKDRDGNILDYCRAIADRHTPVSLPNDFALVGGFTHLFGGAVAYACGYYSYQWSLVLEADAYSRFVATDPLDAGTGRKLRTEILSKGDTEDPTLLFRNFVGRDPNPAALLQRSGLA